ncbi:MAG: hypothetical protein IKN03_07700 [Fibrobacter sp.]|nr:hypothetical protein [Fibrobacter sp.]
MRAGPQLGVDACGVRRYGSVMPVCMQPVATLTLQTFAKVFLGRRYILALLIIHLFLMEYLTNSNNNCC